MNRGSRVWKQYYAKFRTKHSKELTQYRGRRDKLGGQFLTGGVDELRETVHDALVRFDGHADHLENKICARMTANASHSTSNTSTTLRDHWSRCLVNHPHLFFIHPATVHFDFRASGVDLTNIRRRQLNIDRS